MRKLVLAVVLAGALPGWGQAVKPKVKQTAKAAAPAPKPPRRFINSLEMEFVEVPAGTFFMGTDADPSDTEENPRHKVEITKPFFMQCTEVTQDQWVTIMNTHASGMLGKTLPVGGVSWDSAQEFIRYLNVREGLGRFRLPTEAEWEYATRAGTTSTYYFGEAKTELAAHGWVPSNAKEETHPVGTLKPNPWGLKDLYGNVAEWCQDWYGPYTAEAVKDPTGPATGTFKAYRGGSYAQVHTARFATSSARGHQNPWGSYLNYGLRLVWEPANPAELAAANDPAMAKLPWARRAELGDARAQYKLGSAYSGGLGVAKDPALAFQWWMRAANQGLAQAQHTVGWAYDTGTGVAKDVREAFLWYSRAAAQGYPAAQYALGTAYEAGSGITKDLALANQWYQKSVDQGYGPAFAALGYNYDAAIGLTRDMGVASELTRRAAVLGNAVCMHNMGLYYEKGLGVTASRDTAVEWYRKSAAAGYAGAKTALARLGLAE